MKKSSTILSIIIILLVVFAVYFFYAGNSKNVYNEENKSVSEKYPALKTNNEGFLTYMENEVPKNIWANGTTFTFQGKEVSINRDEAYMKISAQCGSKERSLIKYSSHGDSRVDGVFGDDWIIDCDNYYWVYATGSTGPRLYGPFQLK